MSIKAYGRLAEARAVYASTLQGEANLRARLAALDEDSVHAGELRDAIQKGRLLRERNAAIKQAAKSKKTVPPAARRPGPKKVAAVPVARPSGEVTWAANHPDAEANRVGRTLLIGYGLNREHLDMIPPGREYEVYAYVETGMNNDGAYRLIAEYGRGEGMRLYAQERIRNWALTRMRSGNR